MATHLQHLRSLYKNCNLLPEDIRKESRYNKKTGETKEFVLITRTGIEKIISKKKISYKISPVYNTENYAVVKVIGSMNGNEVETMASASNKNCQVNYYPEMAEKRGIARVVIKLTAGAESGLMSDDELNDSDLERVKAKSTRRPVNNAEEKLKKRKSI